MINEKFIYRGKRAGVKEKSDWKKRYSMTPIQCSYCGKTTITTPSGRCADCDTLKRHEWKKCISCGKNYHGVCFTMCSDCALEVADFIYVDE